MKVGDLVLLYGQERTMGTGVVLKFYAGGSTLVKVAFLGCLDNPIKLRRDRLKIIDENFFQKNP